MTEVVESKKYKVIQKSTEDGTKYFLCDKKTNIELTTPFNSASEASFKAIEMELKEESIILW